MDLINRSITFVQPAASRDNVGVPRDVRTFDIRLSKRIQFFPIQFNFIGRSIKVIVIDFNKRPRENCWIFGLIFKEFTEHLVSVTESRQAEKYVYSADRYVKGMGCMINVI